MWPAFCLSSLHRAHPDCQGKSSGHELGGMVALPWIESTRVSSLCHEAGAWVLFCAGWIGWNASIILFVSTSVVGLTLWTGAKDNRGGSTKHTHLPGRTVWREQVISHVSTQCLHIDIDRFPPRSLDMRACQVPVGLMAPPFLPKNDRQTTNYEQFKK